MLDRALPYRTDTNHQRLVARLRDSNNLSSTAFISLNYDILIDNALLFDVRGNGYQPDYGVDFVNDSSNALDHFSESFEATGRACLYKLHGSLNWLYCPACVSLKLTPRQKAAAMLRATCTKCDSNMIPIVIPPTYFKVMSNYYLQQVWRKAEEVLEQAERIHFCGYSFPDADMHIKYMLKRMEINHSSQPDIFIINNPDGKRDEQKREEEQRYRRFFARKDRVHYLDMSFQDFAERGVESD